MVSFQCHGCGDVVKKPKLDQHRCHTGFDCIDCSTTFNTPVEYKSHTSCISEAEKYQKGLYKGAKSSSNRQNANQFKNESGSGSDKTTGAPVTRQSNAQWSRNSQQTSMDNVNGYPGSQFPQRQNGWRNDRYQNGDGGGRNTNRQQNKFSRPNGSGANDIPLGVPRRSSIDEANGAIAVVESTETSEEISEKPEESRKEKIKRKPVEYTDETQKQKPTVTDTAKSDQTSAVVDDNSKAEKKAKKRKYKEANGEAGLEAGPEEKRNEKDTVEETSKVAKKKAKRKVDGTNDDTPTLVDVGDVDVGDKKQAKKEKKLKSKADEEQGTAVDLPGEKTSKRKKKSKDTTDDTETTPIATPVLLEESTTKKDEVVLDAVVEKRKKKEKKGQVDLDVDEKKEKKRKSNLEGDETKKKKKHRTAE